MQHCIISIIDDNNMDNNINTINQDSQQVIDEQ